MFLKLQEQHINPSVIFTCRTEATHTEFYSILFFSFESKSYVTSHVDADVFKFCLHQLSSIIASAIGTTLFAHVNFEYVFVPQKSREATLLFFYSPLSIISHYSQKIFYIGTCANSC